MGFWNGYGIDHVNRYGTNGGVGDLGISSNMYPLYGLQMVVMHQRVVMDMEIMRKVGMDFVYACWSVHRCRYGYEAYKTYLFCLLGYCTFLCTYATLFFTCSHPFVCHIFNISLSLRKFQTRVCLYLLAKHPQADCQHSV